MSRVHMRGLAAGAGEAVAGGGLSLAMPPSPAQLCLPHKQPADTSSLRVVPSPSPGRPGPGHQRLLLPMTSGPGDTSPHPAVGGRQALAEHWNGSVWSVVATSPNPPGPQFLFTAVGAGSSTDVWAIENVGGSQTPWGDS